MLDIIRETRLVPVPASQNVPTIQTLRIQSLMLVGHLTLHDSSIVALPHESNDICV